MKKLLNTLFINSENTLLSREGETIHVEIDKEIKHKFPIHLFQGIVCFGHVMCTPSLFYLCALNKVAISFLSKNGRYIAKVQPPVNGNVLLRREQYRQADNLNQSIQIARSVILGKISNSRTVIMRAVRELREGEDFDFLKNIVKHLARLASSLDLITSLESLRGLEGEAAKSYFSGFDCLILAQKDHFFFKERSRRPPLDNMNALLSFIYTLLAHDVSSALEVVGLDPAVGFLHRDRPGRPSLALDLMEECRSFIADRLAFTLINRQQICGKGFIRSESGDIRMNDETRKQVLVAYQKRKTEEIYHPFIGEKIEIGLIPHVQAMLLARYLRGDLDGYPPFIWR